MTKAALTSVDIVIPFHDNDPMGIVWHGNYFKYFEMARDALLERAGMPIPKMTEEGFGIPVIESHCKYRHALFFMQRIRVYAYVSEWENRLNFKFEVRDPETNALLTTGYTLHAAYDLKQRELLFEIPASLKEKLLATPPEPDPAVLTRRKEVNHAD